MTADDVYAQAARPRAELLALLEAGPAAATPTDSPLPWQVVRQYGGEADLLICAYASERAAERRAVQMTADAEKLGERYTVRRAEA